MGHISNQETVDGWEINSNAQGSIGYVDQNDDWQLNQGSCFLAGQENQ